MDVRKREAALERHVPVVQGETWKFDVVIVHKPKARRYTRTDASNAELRNIPKPLAVPDTRASRFTW